MCGRRCCRAGLVVTRRGTSLRAAVAVIDQQERRNPDKNDGRSDGADGRHRRSCAKPGAIGARPLIGLAGNIDRHLGDDPLDVLGEVVVIAGCRARHGD